MMYLKIVGITVFAGLVMLLALVYVVSTLNIGPIEGRMETHAIQDTTNIGQVFYFEGTDLDFFTEINFGKDGSVNWHHMIRCPNGYDMMEPTPLTRDTMSNYLMNNQVHRVWYHPAQNKIEYTDPNGVHHFLPTGCKNN